MPRVLDLLLASYLQMHKNKFNLNPNLSYLVNEINKKFHKNNLCSRNFNLLKLLHYVQFQLHSLQLVLKPQKHKWYLLQIFQILLCNQQWCIQNYSSNKNSGLNLEIKCLRKGQLLQKLGQIQLQLFKSQLDFRLDLIQQLLSKVIKKAIEWFLGPKNLKICTLVNKQ